MQRTLLSPLGRGLAGLLLSSALARPVAALSPPDLTVSLSGPATSQSGAAVTYHATVTNVPVWTRVCTFDPDLRRRICYPEITSQDAGNVSVDVALPVGFHATGASGAGFSCQLGQTVRCSGGFLLAGDAETISVSATAPSVSAATSFTAVASADPISAVAERSETNNGASQTITVSPPPPPPTPMADLFASEDVTPASCPAWQGATFAVWVHNGGPLAANGFSVQMGTNLPAGIVSWSTGAFTCYGLGGFTQPLDIRCTGSLGPYSSSVMYLTLKLTNPFTPGGTPFTLYGYLDPQNAIPETIEWDNTFTRACIVP